MDLRLSASSFKTKQNKKDNENKLSELKNKLKRKLYNLERGKVYNVRYFIFYFNKKILEEIKFKKRIFMV